MPAAARQRPPLLGGSRGALGGGGQPLPARAASAGRRTHLEESLVTGTHKQVFQARQARHELRQQRAGLPRAGRALASGAAPAHLQRLQRAAARQRRRQIDSIVLLRHRLQRQRRYAEFPQRREGGRQATAQSRRAHVARAALADLRRGGSGGKCVGQEDQMKRRRRQAANAQKSSGGAGS